jgi:predicted phosphoribosyltransferase
LDAEDAAKQFANRLRHVKRKGEPLRLAALAASGLPVAVDTSLPNLHYRLRALCWP